MSKTMNDFLLLLIAVILGFSVPVIHQDFNRLIATIEQCEQRK